MKKDLLALLRKTRSVALKSEVVRTLDEAELASVVGGLPVTSSCCAPNYSGRDD